jgi:hypothetical protein
MVGPAHQSCALPLRQQSRSTRPRRYGGHKRRHAQRAIPMPQLPPFHSPTPNPNPEPHMQDPLTRGAHRHHRHSAAHPAEQRLGHRASRPRHQLPSIARGLMPLPGACRVGPALQQPAAAGHAGGSCCGTQCGSAFLPVRLWPQIFNRRATVRGVTVLGKSGMCVCGPADLGVR